MAVDQGAAWDVVIVGAGPAGLFAAGALAGKLRVLVLEEKDRTGGAGAMTDGKLNLSPHIGLDLSELGMSESEAEARIARIDEVFLEHGADRTLYGEDDEKIGWWLDRVSWVRHRTPKGLWDITLLPARQRHMGTDLAHRVVARMTDALKGKGVAFSLHTQVTDI
ncbi:MAG TPA: FAD-binding protein, partial [Candidatus Deferrimicrobiaceae bacterium]|nr:FAD-binding protein [Candidatus Deferrimicrobiaceae bacterium]